ncbi:MAG: LacI family transcriptional regulator [Actinomycetia bacterium]|nr:LacI family transcriptional regulator [Actinomycetes bacterium]
MEPMSARPPEADRLAHALRELRDRLPGSLRELSAQTHASPSALSRYLTGQAIPPAGFAEQLARLARANPAEVLALRTAALRARRRSRSPSLSRPGSGSGPARVVVGVAGPDRSVLADPYVSRVVAAGAEVCGRLGLGVSLQWLPLAGRDPLGALAEDGGVAGLVLVNTTSELLKGLPRGLRGRVASIGIGSPGVPAVDVDGASGAAAVVEHLYASGRRRIAMVTGPAWLPCSRRPVDAYVRVMQAAGLQVRTVPGDFGYRSGVAGAETILDRWPATDAIFAICDQTALGVLAALADRSVRVPGDVAVAGFDDSPFAAVSWPPLTTATHPVEAIARAAALTVLGGVEGPTRFPSELVRRLSA